MDFFPSYDWGVIRKSLTHGQSFFKMVIAPPTSQMIDLSLTHDAIIITRSTCDYPTNCSSKYLFIQMIAVNICSSNQLFWDLDAQVFYSWIIP
jgi:hypothetical protein